MNRTNKKKKKQSHTSTKLNLQNVRNNNHNKQAETMTGPLLYLRTNKMQVHETNSNYC